MMCELFVEASVVFLLGYRRSCKIFCLPNRGSVEGIMLQHQKSQPHQRLRGTHHLKAAQHRCSVMSAVSVGVRHARVKGHMREGPQPRLAIIVWSRILCRPSVLCLCVLRLNFLATGRSLETNYTPLA